MEALADPTHPLWPFPFTPQDWAQTRLAVQAYVHTLRDEVKQLHDVVEILEARLQQKSTTSSRPPSSDSPYKKPRLRTTTATPRKAGGKLGHPGHRRVLLPPTTVREVRPERCACGNMTLTLLKPYAMLRAFLTVVIELMEVADDSFGCLGDSFRNGFAQYLATLLLDSGVLCSTSVRES